MKPFKMNDRYDYRRDTVVRIKCGLDRDSKISFHNIDRLGVVL